MWCVCVCAAVNGGRRGPYHKVLRGRLRENVGLYPQMGTHEGKKRVNGLLESEAWNEM